MRRREFAWAAAAFALLFAASSAWAPPPSGRPGGVTGGRPPSGGTPRPPVTRPGSSARPEAIDAIDSIRSRSATDAARYLREEAVVVLSRPQRAALLNGIAYEILRQQRQQEISTQQRLAALRQLRSDWASIGPSAGLDPLVEMELAAAEAAAERVVLDRALAAIEARNYAAAIVELAPIAESRYLPAPIAQAIPGLIADLKAAHRNRPDQCRRRAPRFDRGERSARRGEAGNIAGRGRAAGVSVALR